MTDTAEAVVLKKTVVLIINNQFSNATTLNQIETLNFKHKVTFCRAYRFFFTAIHTFGMIPHIIQKRRAEYYIHHTGCLKRRLLVETEREKR